MAKRDDSTWLKKRDKRDQIYLKAMNLKLNIVYWFGITDNLDSLLPINTSAKVDEDAEKLYEEFEKLREQIAEEESKTGLLFSKLEEIPRKKIGLETKIVTLQMVTQTHASELLAIKNELGLDQTDIKSIETLMNSLKTDNKQIINFIKDNLEYEFKINLELR